MKKSLNLISGALSAAVVLYCFGAGAAKQEFNESGTEIKKEETRKQQSCSLKLSGFSVNGSKLYSAEVFDQQLSEYIGQCIDQKLDEQIIYKINSLYQKNGYIYSFVTDIKRVGSKLQISVIEGHIREVIYNESFDNPQMAEYVAKLLEIKPYNKFKAERYLALIKRLPGMVDKIKFTPLLIPFNEINYKDPATVDLMIENHFYRVSGHLNFDNRYRDSRSDSMVPEKTGRVYTRHKGPNFLSATVNINNPFARGGQLNSSITTSMSHEDNYYFLGYNHPLNSYGTKVFTSVSTHLVRWPIKQHTPTVEVGISHQLYLTLEKSLDAYLKLNQYDSKNQYIHTPPAYESFHVKKAILGASYKFTDKFKGSHFYSLNYHQSIKTSQQNLYTSSHDKSFKKILADGMVIYPLFSSDYKIIFEASGQYSKNNLFRTEVFAASIYNGARGFDDSEVYGDKGLSTSVELTRFIPVSENVMIRGFRPYTYLDRSRFWNNEESFYKPIMATLVSYGFGTDLYVHDNIIFNLEYSKPISKSVKGKYFTFDRKPSSRIYFGIRYEFGF